MRTSLRRGLSLAVPALLATIVALMALGVGVAHAHFPSAGGWCNSGSAGAWGSFNSYDGPDGNNRAYIRTDSGTVLAVSDFMLVGGVTVQLDPSVEHRLIVGVDANRIAGDPTEWDWSTEVVIPACVNVATTTPPTAPPAPTTTEATPSTSSPAPTTSSPASSTTSPTGPTTSTPAPTSSSPSASSPDTNEPLSTQPPPTSVSPSPTSPDPTGTPTSSPPLDEPQRCPSNPNEPADSPLCRSLPATGPAGVAWGMWIGVAMLVVAFALLYIARRLPPEVKR